MSKKHLKTRFTGLIEAVELIAALLEIETALYKIYKYLKVHPKAITVIKQFFFKAEVVDIIKSPPHESPGGEFFTARFGYTKETTILSVFKFKKTYEWWGQHRPCGPLM